MAYHAATKKNTLDLCQFTWKDFHDKLLMKTVIDKEDFIIFHLDKNKKFPPHTKKTTQ